MLARDPRDRYQTASELIIDLERSRLASPVLSFRRLELAMQDPNRPLLMASSAEPTRLDVSAAAPEEPGCWRAAPTSVPALYRAQDGGGRKVRATTDQIASRSGARCRRVEACTRAAASSGRCRTPGVPLPRVSRSASEAASPGQARPAGGRKPAPPGGHVAPVWSSPGRAAAPPRRRPRHLSAPPRERRRSDERPRMETSHRCSPTSSRTQPRRTRLTVGCWGRPCSSTVLELDAALTEPSLETGLDAYQVFGVRSAPRRRGTVVNNLAALGVGRIFPVAVIGDDGEATNCAGRSPPSRLSTWGVSSARPSTPTYTKRCCASRAGRRAN